MKKVVETRLNILILFVLGVFLLFSIKLIQYQVIDGEKYYNKSNASTRISQTIYAARGDILDVNGVPMATGRTVFNVVLNKAYMPANQLNDRILQTLEILAPQNEKINDILPMENSYPYSFIKDKEAEISRLRNHLKVAVYATEEDVLSKLIERYSLQDYTQDQQRILGGVRYTMERDGYAAEFPFNLAKDVSLQSVAIITESARDLTGVEISETSQRYYEDGTLLPHILGTVGPIYAEEYDQLKSQGYNINDVLGKDGLEKAYESYLKGTDGTRQIEKNINGEIVDMIIQEEPKPGNNVKLTIDAEFQKAANDILANQVTSLQGRTAGWGKECTGASMVVLDVKTGAVLAICNYPSYDLNLYSSNYSEYASDPNTPLFNRALQGLYRPGSVFKVSVAVAALQAGLIDENFTYTCHGTYNYFTQAQWGGTVPGCTGYTAHGTINVKQALKVSCNCFFYDLGRRLGIDAMNKSANNLGLAVKTGLEINEKQGSLSSPEQHELSGQTWQAGNTIQAAIGQLDTVVTTVQLATYAATVANRGERYSTHIIDSIETYDGTQVIYKTPKTVLSKTENTNNAFDIAEKGMVLASAEGNAKMYLSSLPFVVASKTGTPQVPGDLYNATIMAYGPVENPEIAIAVVAEKGGDGYNLAQSVRDIFNVYYQIKEDRLHPKPSPTPGAEGETTDQSSSNSQGDTMQSGQDQANSNSQNSSASGSQSQNSGSQYSANSTWPSPSPAKPTGN